jgi:hypothetical protein
MYGRCGMHIEFVRNPELEVPLVRHMCVSGDIKIGVKGIGCQDVDWIQLAQDRNQ